MPPWLGFCRRLPRTIIHESPFTQWSAAGNASAAVPGAVGLGIGSERGAVAGYAYHNDADYWKEERYGF